MKTQPLSHKRIFLCIKYTFSILLSASKKYFFLHWSISFIHALFPFFKLLLWRVLLNSLVSKQGYWQMSFFPFILLILCLYGAVIIAEHFLTNIKRIIGYKYNDEIDYYVDTLLVDRISGADMCFFDSGDNLNKLVFSSGNLNRIVKNIPATLYSVVESLIWVTVALITTMKLNIFIPIVLIILSIPTIAIDKIIAKRQYVFQKKHTGDLRRIQYIQSLFSGKPLFEIKLYDIKDFLLGKFEEEWDRYEKISYKHNLMNCVYQTISAFVIMISHVVVFAFALIKLIAKTIGIGDVTYYITIFGEFRWKFVAMAGDITDLLELSKQLYEIRSFVNSTTDKKQTTGLTVSTKFKTIRFEHVWFRYPNCDNYVLKDFNCVFEAGKRYGIIGENGAGKSTLLKLLCRLYDPCAGKITIDDIDIKQVNLGEYRHLISILFQDFVKYSLTVRENIGISDVQRLSDYNAVAIAAKKSKALECMNSEDDLALDLDLELTRRFNPLGKELSGGQWQRIALARAFFRDSPLILLDEPFSSLDPVAENEVLKRAVLVSNNKTAIIISHRLAFAKLCDSLIVIDNGTVVEEGKHNDLMNKRGIYYSFFKLQSDKFLPNA